MLFKKFEGALTSLLFILMFCCYGGDRVQNKIVVLKKGDLIYVRSYFSPEKDVLITMNKGLNGQVNFLNTRLISGTAPLTDVSSGAVVHHCGDDSTPWNLNGTYIGANHGCSDGRELTIKKHGLTVSDIGSEWLDEAGNKFYIIKIASPDSLWILGENKGKDGIWRFNKTIKAPLKNGDRVLKIEEDKMLQIRPAIRIKEQKYLVDGKTPLQDGVPTPCEFLDLKEEYDIICPDSLLEMIQKNPGKEADFAAQSLDSVMTFKTLYRFMPLGACTIDHNVKANRKFNIGHALFVMSMQLNKDGYDMREEYIPKTLPFEKNDIKYNFKAVQDVSGKFPFPIHFSEKEKNIESPDNYPDRFIQFLSKKQGDKITREVGFAIGYSLIDGLGRSEERAKTTSMPIWIHTTSKTYPFAIDPKIGTRIPAGKEFHCLVYRQYFNPAAFSEATAVYWHKELDSYMLYIDYHKAVQNDTVKLPDYLIGKKITVVEKTPSLNLVTGKTVPPGGLVISANEQYGYIVLKLSPQ